MIGLVNAAPDTFLRYIYAKKDFTAISNGQDTEQGSIDRSTGDEQGPAGGEQVDYTLTRFGDTDQTNAGWYQAHHSATETTPEGV